MEYFDKLDFDDRKGEPLSKQEQEAKDADASKARKLLSIEEMIGLSDITSELYEGLQPRIERGKLGLSRVAAAAAAA